MLTLLIATVLGTAAGVLVWYLTDMVILAATAVLVVMVAFNILVGRHFMNKMTDLMNIVEKDIKAERFDLAVEKLKTGYQYSNWQFFVRKQIDSQIGSVLYIRKKFDESLPYLENSFSKNWPARCMLAALYYRQKAYDKAFETMDKAVKSNPKEAFTYSIYAWMLTEQGNVDKAIDVLNTGNKKLPNEERIEHQLDAVKNKKKIKMQAYGAMWMQMHLGKTPDGAKQYQSFLANQKVRRR